MSGVVQLTFAFPVAMILLIFWLGELSYTSKSESAGSSLKRQ